MSPRAATVAPAPPDREVLAGLVERVTFHSEENGFCVLRIKARGHRELVTVVGHAAAIAAGEWVSLATAALHPAVPLITVTRCSLSLFSAGVAAWRQTAFFAGLVTALLAGVVFAVLRVVARAM